MSSTSSSSKSAPAPAAFGVPTVEPVRAQGQIPDQMWFLLFVSHASRLAALVANLRVANGNGKRAEIDSTNTAFRNWTALNRNRFQTKQADFNMGEALLLVFTAVKDAVTASSAGSSLAGEDLLNQFGRSWYQPRASADELVQKLTIGKSTTRFFIRKSASQPGQFALHYQKGTSPAAYMALISPVGSTAGWKFVGSDKKTYEFPSLSVMLNFIDPGLVDSKLQEEEKGRPKNVLKQVIDDINSVNAGRQENLGEVFQAMLQILLYIGDMFLEPSTPQNVELKNLILENVNGLVKCAAYAMSNDSASSANQYEQVLASAIKVVLRLDELNKK